MNFTEAQLRAITVLDRSLIVSAGAGAGKTRTLIERLYRLLAEGGDPCSLDEVLVVTFSRAAAAEMKHRLAARLQAAAEDATLPPQRRDFLRQQLYALPRARVSTLHSFCMEVISAAPERVGLAPGFDLMDEHEQRLFAREFLTARVEETLAPDHPERALLLDLLQPFDPLIAVRELVTNALAFQAFLNSLPHPEAFADQAEALLDPSPERRSALLAPRIAAVLRGVQANLPPLRLQDFPDLHVKLREQLVELQGIRSTVDDTLRDRDLLNALPALTEVLRLSRMPSIRNSEGLPPSNARFRKLRDEAKTAIDHARKVLENLHAAIASEKWAGNTAEATRFFVRVVGLRWGKELFEEHLKVRRLTFAHLERLSSQLLVAPDGAPTPLAIAFREQFRHVLVDEYQDINRLQQTLLNALARPLEAGVGGNLFLVGDLKQSIYEFRQADPTLFREAYANAVPLVDGDDLPLDARVDLKENFRSEARLLAEFNTFFRLFLTKETLGVDYDREHAFIPGKRDPVPAPEGALPRRPGFHLTLVEKASGAETTAWVDAEDEDVSLEARDVARRIRQLGPPYRDIAVLVWAKSVARGLMQALEAEGVPYFCDARVGFLTAVEILELRSILEAIENPWNDTPLLAALRGSAGEWSEDDLLELRLVDRDAPFLANLEQLAAQESHRLRTRATDFLARLRRWQEVSLRLPMEEFFAVLFDDLHLVERALVRPGGEQRRLNLLQMLDHARAFDRFLRKGLREFLTFLDDVIEQEEDFSPPSPLAANADVVRIMTVHFSKGLEFPVVFVPFLGRKFPQASQKSPFLWDRDLGVAMRNSIPEQSEDEDAPPQETTPLCLVLREARQRKERFEQLRVLYVALTRAIRSVHLSATLKRPMDELRRRFDNEDRRSFPPTESLVEAGCVADWLLEWAARHFTLGVIPENDPGPFHCKEGIRSLEVLSVPQVMKYAGTLQGRRSVPPPAVPASYLEALGAAAERVEALVARPAAVTIRAKLSATEAKRAFDASRQPESPPAPAAPPQQAPRRRLLPERIIAPATGEEPLRVGTLTHRFLSLCDLVALAHTRTSLSAEATRLVAEGAFTSQEAAALPLHDIGHFLNSPLGRRLRRSYSNVRREVPFTVRVDPGELGRPEIGEPLVLQGVVDLLLELEEGYLLLDYKTDSCGPANERLPALVEHYTPQLQIYRYAVEKTHGVSVVETWLVFLRGREAVAVPPANQIAVPTERILEVGAFYTPDSSRQGPRNARLLT